MIPLPAKHEATQHSIATQWLCHRINLLVAHPVAVENIYYNVEVASIRPVIAKGHATDLNSPFERHLAPKRIPGYVVIAQRKGKTS
jgi:hypothetical protein